MREKKKKNRRIFILRWNHEHSVGANLPEIAVRDNNIRMTNSMVIIQGKVFLNFFRALMPLFKYIRVL